MYVYMRMIYVTVYLSFGAMFWNVWTLKLVSFGAWKRQQKNSGAEHPTFWRYSPWVEHRFCPKDGNRKDDQRNGCFAGGIGFWDLGTYFQEALAKCSWFLCELKGAPARVFWSSLIPKSATSRDLGRPLGPIRIRESSRSSLFPSGTTSDERPRQRSSGLRWYSGAEHVGAPRGPAGSRTWGKAIRCCGRSWTSHVQCHLEAISSRIISLGWFLGVKVGIGIYHCNPENM